MYMTHSIRKIIEKVTGLNFKIELYYVLSLHIVTSQMYAMSFPVISHFGRHLCQLIRLSVS